MRMSPVFVEMGGPDVVYGTLQKPLGLWASTKVGFVLITLSGIRVLKSEFLQVHSAIISYLYIRNNYQVLFWGYAAPGTIFGCKLKISTKINLPPSVGFGAMHILMFFVCLFWCVVTADLAAPGVTG